MIEGNKYNLEWLLELVSKKNKMEYIFFWGHQPKKDGSVSASCFSQWWHEGFNIDKVHYATVEHWMMAKKAELFGDTDILQQILLSKSPKEAKQLGRQVRGFINEVWEENAYDIVCEGNYHKFSYNPHLKDFLLSTQDRVLVEASPVDNIWGIGLSADDDNVDKPRLWKGKNLLGFALMEVRDRLRMGLELKRK